MTARHRHGALLTCREIEVARLVVHGCSDAEIAAHLDISLYTVRSHLRNISKSLSVDCRVDIAIYALKVGLVALDDIELPGSAAQSEVTL